ncbi:response regulator transcription factor [Nocardioides sp. zg-DK7169]|nr:response regulator transcription factor [Nocardioides sp. zg-DK7169]NPC96596.1 response regulator transcription factor [Nocardioides sp. zg-DK7169]
MAHRVKDLQAVGATQDGTRSCGCPSHHALRGLASRVERLCPCRGRAGAAQAGRPGLRAPPVTPRREGPQRDPGGHLLIAGREGDPTAATALTPRRGVRVRPAKQPARPKGSPTADRAPLGDGWVRVWLVTHDPKRPLRLAIVDDYAVVVAGVAAFLADERIDVVETGASTPVVSDVDVVLYDTFAQVQGTGVDLEDFVRDSDAYVVVYSWNLDHKLIQEAIDAGARGYLSKVLTGPQIVAALERVVRGEIVILPGDEESSVEGDGDWPGRSAGLSPREAEVIALITQGLSNQEIAARVFLSINTVKTYIRTAYQKIGVTRRPQAVLWGMQNGFQPDTLRTIDSELVLRTSRRFRGPGR